MRKILALLGFLAPARLTPPALSYDECIAREIDRDSWWDYPENTNS